MAERLGHQLVPDVRDLPEVHVRPRGGRVPEARQRRDDHLEGVRRVAAECGRGGEPVDDLRPVPEGPGPPMAEDQRDGVGPGARLAHEVNAGAGHVNQVVLVGIHRPLGSSPVVLLRPVPHQLLEQGPGDAVPPVLVPFIVRPDRRPQPRPQILENPLLNGDRRRRQRIHACAHFPLLTSGFSSRSLAAAKVNKIHIIRTHTHYVGLWDWRGPVRKEGPVRQSPHLSAHGRQLGIAILAVLGCAVLVIGPGAKPASAAPAFAFMENYQTGLCLASNGNGQVWTESCNYGSSEEWEITPTPSSTPNQAIQSVTTGLWLDSNFAGNLYTDPGNGGAYQSWVVLYPNDDGMFAFQDVATGRWLDSNYAGAAYTNPGNGGTYQSWSVQN